MVRMLVFGIALLFTIQGHAQHYDTLIGEPGHQQKITVYPVAGAKLLYPRPKIYTFLTNVPRTFRDLTRDSFRKKSLPAWGVIVGTTGVLLVADQSIANEVQQFSRFIGLDATRKYKEVVTIKVGKSPLHVYEAPQNLNSALYSLGEGLPPILISAGLLLHGAIKHDTRSISTASQIIQSNLTMGILTQVLKRVSGRESPFEATQSGGAWHFLPSFKTYQHNVPHYDAFPSGHMGTMMSTVTVIALNYPEKKWIKPVGYALMTVVGLAMINNGVHWASDYPLAIGLGYVSAKATVNMSRLVDGSLWKRK
jgi:membrane-associated phospholipid phosphatase